MRTFDVQSIQLDVPPADVFRVPVRSQDPPRMDARVQDRRQAAGDDVHTSGKRPGRSSGGRLGGARYRRLDDDVPKRRRSKGALSRHTTSRQEHLHLCTGGSFGTAGGARRRAGRTVARSRRRTLETRHAVGDERPRPACVTDDLEPLVASAREGDRDSLERLVVHIQRPVYNLALRMLWHPEDARDASQEILYASSRTWARFAVRAVSSRGCTASRRTT